MIGSAMVTMATESFCLNKLLENLRYHVVFLSVDLRVLRAYSPTPVNVNCRLKYFVTLVTYCYNNVFVYFNQQLTLTGVGEYGPKRFNLTIRS
jgi:hypothetical protein